jgi:hypothetical protein
MPRRVVLALAVTSSLATESSPCLLYESLKYFIMLGTSAASVHSACFSWNSRNRTTSLLYLSKDAKLSLNSIHSGISVPHWLTRPVSDTVSSLQSISRSSDTMLSQSASNASSSFRYASKSAWMSSYKASSEIGMVSRTPAASTGLSGLAESCSKEIILAGGCAKIVSASHNLRCDVAVQARRFEGSARQKIAFCSELGPENVLTAPFSRGSGLEKGKFPYSLPKNLTGPVCRKKVPAVPFWGLKKLQISPLK